MYVLRRVTSTTAANGQEPDENSWQWWRISFSTEDSKARRAKKVDDHLPAGAPEDADVVGYTARQVQEIDVLSAARQESRSVLLVYASSTAMENPEAPAPAQLQVRFSVGCYRGRVR